MLPAPRGRQAGRQWGVTAHAVWQKAGAEGLSAAQSQASSQPGFVGSTFLTKVGITYWNRGTCFGAAILHMGFFLLSLHQAGQMLPDGFPTKEG